MFTPIQIILVCAWMWGFTVIGMSVQLFSYGVAVLHGFVTGLIMGDVATGLTVGGTLCLMGLGVGGYGGSSVPDYAMGTVVGTVFAIATGGGVEGGLDLLPENGTAVAALMADDPGYAENSALVLMLGEDPVHQISEGNGTHDIAHK